MKVLVVNCGSSSLKYQLIDMDNEKWIAKGICEAINNPGNGIFKISTADGRKYEESGITIASHTAGFTYVKEGLTENKYGCKVINDISEIDAIGHRIVQGGWLYDAPALVTDKVIADIDALSELAPLHNPASIQGINACIATFGKSVPQVTVFDNAYHSTMPDCASIFPIPYEYTEKYNIRRYGAHGTSHKYINSEAKKILGKSEYKLISCHIGSGASITAIKDGKVIDTSMGLTPLDGFIMGTRSGGIDPSVVTYLQEKEGWTPGQTSTVLNKKSGMKGICGEDDERLITKLIEKGGEQAEKAMLARRIQRYQIKKFIGAYAAALNGVDMIAFTAGIGEHSDDLRKEVCDGLTYLGVKIDDEANENVGGGIEKISSGDSKVLVYVIPTNEELMIARETKAIAETLAVQTV